MVRKSINEIAGFAKVEAAREAESGEKANESRVSSAAAEALADKSVQFSFSATKKKRRQHPSPSPRQRRGERVMIVRRVLASVRRMVQRLRQGIPKRQRTAALHILAEKLMLPKFQVFSVQFSAGKGMRKWHPSPSPRLWRGERVMIVRRVLASVLRKVRRWKKGIPKRQRTGAVQNLAEKLMLPKFQVFSVQFSAGKKRRPG